MTRSPAPRWAAPAGAVYGATEERILSAALGLVGRRGVKRLGMQEVSEAAGVSRGTLYRYFPSKDHLLDAVAGYDEARFTTGLAAALAPVHGPAERIHTLVAFAFDYIRLHPARSLFASEPEFVLGYLFQHLPKLRDALLEQLGEAFDSVPAVASGNLSREPTGRRRRASLRLELDHAGTRRSGPGAIHQCHPRGGLAVHR